MTSPAAMGATNASTDLTPSYVTAAEAASYVTAAEAASYVTAAVTASVAAC